MPFNWNNPIGYTVTVFIEYIIATHVFFTMMSMLSIGIAGYLYEMSLAKDINQILQSIDDSSKTKKRRQSLCTQFIEFVDLHSVTKQLNFCSHFILLIRA